MPRSTPLDRLPYPLLCSLLGFGLGWLPLLLHGPIPEKFNVLYIQGSVAIWTFYVPRLAIGFWVGISAWPRQWWLRGPLLGALAMLGPGMLALGMPQCGSGCMARNIASGALVGALVGAIAYAITRRHHLDTGGQN
jgi:hypothetical protein